MQPLLRSLSLSCLLAIAAHAHADTVYTSAAAYNAATTTTATATFNNLAPANSYTDETPTFTNAGITFTSLTPTSGLYVTDPGFEVSSYSDGDFLTQDFAFPADILQIAFPSSNAVAFNFGGLLDTTTSFIATLSDGFSYTFSTVDSIGTTNSLDFIGFTTSAPITGLTLTLPDDPSYSALDNVSYGTIGATASAVPEPSSLLLLGTGAVTLLSTLRRKAMLRAAV